MDRSLWTSLCGLAFVDWHSYIPIWGKHLHLMIREKADVSGRNNPAHMRPVRKKSHLHFNTTRIADVFVIIILF